MSVPPGSNLDVSPRKRRMLIAMTNQGAALVPDIGDGPRTDKAFLMTSPSPSNSRGAPGTTPIQLRLARRDRRKGTMKLRAKRGRR